MSDWRKRRIKERMGKPRRLARPLKDRSLQLLVEAAHEDRELQAFFRRLHKMHADQRDAVLDRLLADAEAREAEAEFVEAVDRLHDPVVLEKLLRLL